MLQLAGRMNLLRKSYAAASPEVVAKAFRASEQMGCGPILLNSDLISLVAPNAPNLHHSLAASCLLGACLGELMSCQAQR